MRGMMGSGMQGQGNMINAGMTVLFHPFFYLANIDLYITKISVNRLYKNKKGKSLLYERLHV